MTTATTQEVELLYWARPLCDGKQRYKVLYGGRGSGKTYQMAGALALLGYERAIRVCCAREFQSSIAESCKQAIDGWIHRLGLAGSHYRILRNEIIGKNGTRFFFRGMSTATEEAIRGWESVDICWVEEAQRMSARSREILYPTIRKPGSQIWMSFNPKHRYDPVYIDFIARQRDDAWVRRVNYDDNKFFPAELEAERLACLRDEPERYAHVWLGEPDDEGAERQVLPYAMLQKCVTNRKSPGGRLHAGLDVADSGADKNALVIRRGPMIEEVMSWSAGTLGATARRVDGICRERGVDTLYYDSGGIGAGIRSYLSEIHARTYAAHGVNFGEAVAGGKMEFSRGQTNADFFARRNAQLGWALRLRAQASQQLKDDGGGVSLGQCLFIPEDMRNREAYMAQLSQPQWEEQMAGRVVIDKQPDDAPSPDMYDATALAFAHDSRYGLRSRGVKR